MKRIATLLLALCLLAVPVMAGGDEPPCPPDSECGTIPLPGQNAADDDSLVEDFMDFFFGEGD